MYGDLIKRIWECASGECFNCSQYQETTNASVCSKELLREAADAIEELDMITDNLNYLYKEATTWIPVTERLPEDGQRVLVLKPPYGNSTRYYYSVVYFSTNLEKVDEYDFQGKNRSGFYSLDSEYGWCEDYGVVYWMPLPEPPKGE